MIAPAHLAGLPRQWPVTGGGRQDNVGNVEVMAPPVYRCLLCRGDRFDRLDRRRPGLATDDRDVRLDDPGFLACDRRH